MGLLKDPILKSLFRNGIYSSFGEITFSILINTEDVFLWCMKKNISLVEPNISTRQDQSGFLQPSPGSNAQSGEIRNTTVGDYHLQISGKDTNTGLEGK